MAQRSLAARVQILEETVQTFADLPERVAALEGQIVQFRAEVRSEFAAIRGEMVTKADLEAMGMATKADLAELRRHMQVLHEDVVTRLSLLAEGGSKRI